MEHLGRVMAGALLFLVDLALLAGSVLLGVIVGVMGFSAYPTRLALGVLVGALAGGTAFLAGDVARQWTRARLARFLKE